MGRCSCSLGEGPHFWARSGLAQAREDSPKRNESSLAGGIGGKGGGGLQSLHSSPGPVVELDPRPTPIEIFPCAVQVNLALEGIPGSSELQPEEVRLPRKHV
ncbi:hypothetical protein DEO72_LG6g86 [Vigna unguiculata]|uniref:Uncharacterized protein n=1 Tax=Vigna unguiculata TaxID=3917 RepID=A0A4D6M5X9_VIGUN|nr:hypothetical protein DEO72_LG6g86 [Vigna unguiculata]